MHKGFKSWGKEQYAVRGILMHSSLAVTTEGLPLGSDCHQVLEPE